MLDFAPHENDLLGIPTHLTQLVGSTPLIRLVALEDDFNLKSPLYAKLEMMNPGGSVKDRVGYYMVRDALEAGILKPHTVVIEPTSGNTGVGLAIALAGRRNPLITVMPNKMSREKELMLKALGALVLRTPTSEPPESPLSYYNVARALASAFWSLPRKPVWRDVVETVEWVSECVSEHDARSLARLVEEATLPNDNAWIPNQYANPSNPRAHEETTGPEIWEQTRGSIEILVAGMGTGGTITGAVRFLKRVKPSLRVVGVDPVGSAYYHIKRGLSPQEAARLAHTYLVEGIGEDMLPETIDLDLVDEIIRVSDQQAFSMARYLARRTGILAGSSSGAAVYAAVKLLAERGYRAAVTVVILPDTGRNYLTKFYDDEWMRAHGFETDDVRVLEGLGLERRLY